MTEETQTKATTWLEVESENLPSNFSGERLPSLKFEEENKVYLFKIDFSKEFGKYVDSVNKDKSGNNIVKAIIPCTLPDGTRANWWLNKKNPSYQAIIKAGKAGQTDFKVMRTGVGTLRKFVFVK